MKTKRVQVIVLAALVCLALLTGSNGLAGGGSDYALTWWTIDGGGHTHTNSGYTIHGTVGQPDAGQTQTHGVYTLASGYWPGNPRLWSKIYLPLITK